MVYNNSVDRSKNLHCLSRLFSLDRLVVNLMMLEDEESQTHLEPLERESAEEWRTGTGRCEVQASEFVLVVLIE